MGLQADLLVSSRRISTDFSLAKLPHRKTMLGLNFPFHNDVKEKLSLGIPQLSVEKGINSGDDVSTDRGNCMKDKIKAEAIEWYGCIEKRTDQSIESFVELIIDRTVVALINDIKTVLKKEFKDGTLKHNHIISPEYYLDLKLKEAKQNFFSNDKPTNQTKEDE